MNLNRFTAILSAAIIAGFTHTLAAEEQPGLNQADNLNTPAVTEQEIIVDAALEEAKAPDQVIVQTEEKFLSEIKVYPAF